MINLESDINEFYVRFNLGHYDHPYDLAKALEKLTDKAWDNLDELYPQSMLP